MLVTSDMTFSLRPQWTLPFAAATELILITLKQQARVLHELPAIASKGAGGQGWVCIRAT